MVLEAEEVDGKIAAETSVNAECENKISIPEERKDIEEGEVFANGVENDKNSNTEEEDDLLAKTSRFSGKWIAMIVALDRNFNEHQSRPIKHLVQQKIKTNTKPNLNRRGQQKRINRCRVSFGMCAVSTKIQNIPS